TVDAFGSQIIFQPSQEISCGNGDTTLTAMWTKNPTVISFDANGGTGAPDPQTCNEGEVFTLTSVVPTRDGYTFVHWETGGFYWPSGDPITNDPGGEYICGNTDGTNTAIWELATVNYDVTYVYGNGDPDATTVCQAPTTFTAAGAPTRQWFIFDGWFTPDGTVQPGDEVPCSEMTLTAIWSADMTDTDGDGVIDSEEETGCENTVDCDNDGLTDDLDADDTNSDQDGDGVQDGDEQDASCITLPDCDNDGLTDLYDTDDLDSDQDDDGVADGDEEDPSCITNTDCDSDGLADALDQDDLDSDQDDDGVLDGQDPDHATTDTDGDGIPDVSEIEGCENTNDCDSDGVLDGAEEADVCITDPDCDDDGVLDVDETAGCAATTDCDSDGLTDDLDADDLDSDQDDDGVLDGDETAGCVTVPDCDQDGLGDADDADDTNPDQDGDG
ncbi:MAG: hypothetical protein EBY45_16000, partial [Gammaproteobacteria bacterium]|nr:hypothetical protein [Gammaproteobacteria bacterium]